MHIMHHYGLSHASPTQEYEPLSQPTNTISPDCVTELAIAADVLFGAEAPVGDPVAVMHALCRDNPMFADMVPTVIAVAPRLMARIEVPKTRDGHLETLDQMVDLAIGVQWGIQDERLVRAKMLIRTLGLPQSSDQYTDPLLTDPTESASDFVLIMQFVLALTALITRAEHPGHTQPAGYALLQVTGQA